MPDNDFIGISEAAKKLKLSIDQVAHLIEDRKLIGYFRDVQSHAFMARVVGGIRPFKYCAMSGDIKSDGESISCTDSIHYDMDMVPLDITTQPYAQPPYKQEPGKRAVHILSVTLDLKDVNTFIQKSHHLKSRIKADDSLVFVIREAVNALTRRGKRWTHRDVLIEIKKLAEEDRRVRLLIDGVDLASKTISWSDEAWPEEPRPIRQTSMKTLSRRLGDMFPKSGRKAPN